MNPTNIRTRLGAGLMGALALAMLAASCASPSPSPAPGTGAPSSPAPDPVDKTLTIAVGNEYVPYIESIKSGFEAETGWSLTIDERETQDTLDSLPLDGAAGIGPDVTLVPYDRIGQLASAGTIAEVQLPGDDRFYENNVKQVSFEGKVYGQPAIVESIILYWNKDLLSAPPETFAELEKLAESSDFAEGDRTVAFLAPWNAPYIVYGLIAGYGGYVFGDSGTNPNEIGLNNDGAVEAVEYAKTWFDRWPTGMLDIKTNGQLVLQNFTTGKTAAIIAGPWDAAAIKDTGVNYGVSKIPVLPNGNEYRPFGGGKASVVSNYSTKQDGGQLLLDYLTSETSQQALYDLKNEVPANKVVHAAIQQGDDELVKAVIAQYALSEPAPNIPEMSEFWGTMESALFNAFKGDVTVREALDQGVAEFAEAIASKYK